jgi:hypothetical protein
MHDTTLNIWSGLKLADASQAEVALMRVTREGRYCRDCEGVGGYLPRTTEFVVPRRQAQSSRARQALPPKKLSYDDEEFRACPRNPFLGLIFLLIFQKYDSGICPLPISFVFCHPYNLSNVYLSATLRVMILTPQTSGRTSQTEFLDREESKETAVLEPQEYEALQ